MSAIWTNIITDAMLALFLFFICVRTIIERARGNEKFTGFIILFFITVFILSLLGSFAHYLDETLYPEVNLRIWLAIGVLVVFLNYCIVYSMNLPDAIRMMIVFISLFFLYFFIISLNYIFIALSMLFAYISAALYAKRLARIGFIAVVTANLVWMVLRISSNYVLGYELPVQYRYDNDVYHVLLIVAVYILFKAIRKGDWSYPKSM